MTDPTRRPAAPRIHALWHQTSRCASPEDRAVEFANLILDEYCGIKRTAEVVSIDDLELNIASKNALFRAGYRFVHQIPRSHEVLCMIKNIGPDRADEILAAIEPYWARYSL